MEILHLTLTKKWFEAIANGSKTVEYRQIKPYFSKRLINRTYDEIHFRNGYNPSSPMMVVEYKGYTIGKSDYYPNDEAVFCIQLGKIKAIYWHGKPKRPEQLSLNLCFQSD